MADVQFEGKEFSKRTIAENKNTSHMYFVQDFKMCGGDSKYLMSLKFELLFKLQNNIPLAYGIFLLSAKS